MRAIGRLKTNGCFLLVCLSVAVYLLTFFTMKVRLYGVFKMGMRDLSLYDQALWNLVSTGAPYSSLLGTSLLGEHAVLIIYLLAPLYLVWTSPAMLFFVQSLLLGMAALPLYFLAETVLKSRPAALLCALSYLFFPSTGFVNMDEMLYGFHPISFIPFLYIAMFYCLLKGKRATFFLLAVIALSVREDSALSVCTIGIAATIFTREVRLGLVTVMVSVCWFVIATRLVVPSFHGGSFRFFNYYGYLGGSAGEILRTIIFNPAYPAGLLWKNGLATYCLVFLAPVLFIPLLSPGILLMALPPLVCNLLTDPAMYLVPHDYVSWHTAYILPFVVIAAVYGLGRMEKLLSFVSGRFRGKGRIPSPLHCSAALMFSGVLAAHLFYGVTPLSLSFWDVPVYPLTRYPFSSVIFKRDAYRYAGKESALLGVKSMIPENASLSATFYLGTHFAQRAQLYWFPQKKETADFILLDSERAVHRDAVAEFIGEGGENHTPIFARQGIYLYKRFY